MKTLTPIKKILTLISYLSLIKKLVFFGYWEAVARGPPSYAHPILYVQDVRGPHERNGYASGIGLES